MDYSKEELKRFMELMELTATNTRKYLDSLWIEQRVLGTGLVDMKVELWNENFDLPVATAALSDLYFDRDGKKIDGMVELAEGVKQTNALMMVGMNDNEKLEKILQTGAKTIKIIKPYADEEEIYDRIRFCEENGALAIGMDVDHAIGFRGENMDIGGKQMELKSLEQLEKYVSFTKLPFIIKDVLSVHDALMAQKIGAKAIVVGHHHGLCPYGIPPLGLLPEIRKAVGKDMKIFVDCGINSGSDVFKALALGADFACIGRGILPSLKEKGSEGAKTYINNMAYELKVMLTRTGSKDPQHIDPSVIWAQDKYSNLGK